MILTVCAHCGSKNVQTIDSRGYFLCREHEWWSDTDPVTNPMTGEWTWATWWKGLPA